MTNVNKKIYSGELFDLGVGSLNNKFGKEHIEHVMKNGIYFELDKFINELEMIITDDQRESNQKTEKRKQRLIFLKICKQSPVIEELFGLFCAHINGGGDNDDIYQYKNNLLLITVAGGNIFTLFAQILINIYGYSLGSNNLMKINNYFLDELEVRLPDGKILQDKNQLIYKIKYFIENGDGTSGLSLDFEPYLILNEEILKYINLIANLPYSDFDFKLSPNISPDNFDNKRAILIIEQAIKTGQLGSINPQTVGSPGFLLLRTKSYIICNALEEELDEDYTPKQLNEYKKDCAKYDSILGIETQKLYPQIMQRQYLDSIDQSSNCYKFLEHLQKKKDIIAESTEANVEEVTQLFNKGLYEKASRDGTMAPVIQKSDTMTEALILYLFHISKTLNDYLNSWENNKLSPNAAPGLNYKSSVLENSTISFSDKYYKILQLFGTVESLLYGEDSLIPRLMGDLMNFYINFPNFQTEKILDKLLLTYNSKNNNKCKLAPANIIIVPTNQSFNSGLKIIKDILLDSLYNSFGEIGFPDGLRITINAIDTTKYEPTQSQIDSSVSNVDYIPAPRKSLAQFVKTSNPPYLGFKGGLPFKNKKSKKTKGKKPKKTKDKKPKKTKAKKNKKPKQLKNLKKTKKNLNKKINKTKKK